MDIGVAYYPEHWPEHRWADDFALMADAGLTRVRLGEFAWCRLEPREGEFDFAWLEKAVSLAADKGIRALLCTPTQAPPPWMSMNYPETRPRDSRGLQYAQGGRRHVDAASPAYRYFAMRIADRMARYFGSDDRVWGWQLDNEIGAHTHFVSSSPQAQAVFREWLRKKYGTVDALNEAWGLIFWSGEVREWSEIEIRENAPTGVNPAFLKDVRTFGQEMWVDFLIEQYRTMKPHVGSQPIMHNVAWYGEQIDIWRMGERMDIAGIDMYQSRPELLTAVDDLYSASAGEKPWAVLEMGAGTGVWTEDGQAGYHDGRLRATLIKHAVAGATLASMFRFAPSPSGCEQSGEQTSGGLRDSFSRPGRAVAEVRSAREAIDKLRPFLQRKRPEPTVAIVWDTDNLIWSEMMPVMGSRRRMVNDYPREIQEIHHQFTRRGLRPTYTRFGRDWSGYDLVIVWDQVLADAGQAEQIRQYVGSGGAVLANYCLGYFTRQGRRTACPLPLDLIDVFGCTVREGLRSDGDGPVIVWGDTRIEPESRACTLSAEGGQVLANWWGWQGAADAALVVNSLGKGRTAYLGALIDREGWDALLPPLLDYFGMKHGCPVAEHPDVEAIPDRGAWVVCNVGRQPVEVAVEGDFTDLLTDETVQSTLRLPGYGLAVLDPAGKA